MHRHADPKDSIDESFDLLLRQALDEYASKQDAFKQAIAPFDAWLIDEDLATLSMTGAGRAATFPLIPIGTYLPESESFCWAWANDAFPDASRANASRIKAMGDRTGYGIFERAQFRARGTDLDELCALALLALEGTAVFKQKNDSPWVFYAVGSTGA
ncbi:DUF6882 domain-containing protein [Roseateles chitinivorans]|uniref:DUF6882 domain-containing protein n=1 Tax=Roseateles chitinivorans TaxID=2917965 RepID=UPI003D676DD7